jgi:hypothetical protein
MNATTRNDLAASAAVLLAILVSVLCGWFVIGAAGAEPLILGHLAM